MKSDFFKGMLFRLQNTLDRLNIDNVDSGIDSEQIDSSAAI